MSDLTKRQWLNIYCILRSLDLHELDGGMPGFDWESFRDDPHQYFLKCPSSVSDMIWDAVKRRM